METIVKIINRAKHCEKLKNKSSRWIYTLIKQRKEWNEF